MASNNPPVRWAIDLGWYDEKGKSFVEMAESRLCSDCRAERGGATTAVTTSEEAQSIIETIGRCCSLNLGYITRHTPVKEAIFRLVLASGNEPLTVEQLLAQLEEHLSPSARLSTLTTNALERILQHDLVYGFRPVPEPEVEPELPEAFAEGLGEEEPGEAMALAAVPEVESPGLEGEEPQSEEEAAGGGIVLVPEVESPDIEDEEPQSEEEAAGGGIVPPQAPE